MMDPGLSVIAIAHASRHLLPDIEGAAIVDLWVAAVCMGAYLAKLWFGR